MKTIRLVMVLGTSPAVVTETLFALEIQSWLDKRIGRIEIVTTSEGKRQGEAVLQHKLVELYSYYKIAESPPEVYWHVAHDASNRELFDVTTPEESEAMGNTILRIVADCCSEPGEIVYASIAGGRKTMSYYMGLALSIFARQEDKLFHVLVPTDVERNREFFFPMIGDESPIVLPELPFPRLRGFLEKRNQALYDQSIGFADLIDAANQALGPSLPIPFTLLVDCAKMELSVLGTEFEPLPIEARFLRTFEQFLSSLAQQPKPCPLKPNYINQINSLLSGHFGPRARILHRGGSGRKKAEYFLHDQMRIELRGTSNE